MGIIAGTPAEALIRNLYNRLEQERLNVAKPMHTWAKAEPIAVDHSGSDFTDMDEVEPPPQPQAVRTMFNATFRRERFTVEQTLAVICQAFATTPEEIRSGRQGITYRRFAMYLLHCVADYSYPRLGGVFVCDQSTVRYNVVALSELIEADPEVASVVGELEEALRTHTPPPRIVLRRLQPQTSESPPLKRSRMTAAEIVDLTSQAFGFTPQRVRGGKRTRELVLCRQAAMYLLKKYTHFSMLVIAREVGRKDHSTVLHAIGKIEALLASDAQFAADLALLDEKILGAQSRVAA